MGFLKNAADLGKRRVLGNALASKPGQTFSTAKRLFEGDDQDRDWRCVQIGAAVGVDWTVVKSHYTGLPGGVFLISFPYEIVKTNAVERIVKGTADVFKDHYVSTATVKQIEWHPITESYRTEKRFADAGVIQRSPIPGTVYVGTPARITDPELLMDPWMLAESLAESAPNQIVYGFREEDGITIAEFGEARSRPRYFDAERWIVEKNAKSGDLDELAIMDGRRLVNRDGDTAVVARLTQHEERFREIAAQLIPKCEPEDLEVQLSWVADESTPLGRLDTIELLRHPSLGSEPEKRAEMVKKIIALAVDDPKDAKAWTFSESALDGTVRAVYGRRRSLDETVEMRDLLPEDVRTDLWNFIPMGRDANGKIAGYDLKLGPHGAIVGPTGTGKTFALQQYIASVLSRGFEVCLIDVAKEGADFKGVEPYLSATAYDLKAAADLLITILWEMNRRKKLVKEFTATETAFWADVPVEIRNREGINPISVVIDEYAALTATSKQKADPKSPIGIALKAAADQREAIVYAVDRIAAEARAWGVYLMLGTQRASGQVMDTDFRANITSRTQLVKPGSPPARESLAMLFNGEEVKDAFDLIEELDDGKSRGFGITAADGGGVEGFRVAFSKTHVSVLLDGCGVPKTAFTRPTLDFNVVLEAILTKKVESLASQLTTFRSSPELDERGRVVLPTPNQSIYNLWDSQYAHLKLPPLTDEDVDKEPFAGYGLPDGTLGVKAYEIKKPPALPAI